MSRQATKKTKRQKASGLVQCALLLLIQFIIDSIYLHLQIIFPSLKKREVKMKDEAVVVERTIKDKIQKALNRRSTAGQVKAG